MTTIPHGIKMEAQSRDFKVSVRVGKSGITDMLIDEIHHQLKARSLVKIKINKGLIERQERNEVWQFLADSTHSTLVLQRGNIGVLWKSS